MYKSFLKRTFDFFLALVGIAITSPIWVIAILGILISDFGPIFHISIRAGKDNKEFKMLKFRSMKVLKCDDESALRPQEERIFLWGKLMRMSKIDELPQLINVLIGQMALVGPRPVAKFQMNIFRTEKYDETKNVDVGLTGLGALYDFIYGEQFEDSDIDEYMKMVMPTRRELEYVYLNKIGFWFDLWILLATVWVVVTKMFGAKNKKILNKLIKLSKEGI